jgi:hypothetical protein
MYSLKCSQCERGFLSSLKLESPICGKCLQRVKSFDSTLDHEPTAEKAEFYMGRMYAINATSV